MSVCLNDLFGLSSFPWKCPKEGRPVDFPQTPLLTPWRLHLSISGQTAPPPPPPQCAVETEGFHPPDDIMVSPPPPHPAPYTTCLRTRWAPPCHTKPVCSALQQRSLLSRWLFRGQTVLFRETSTFTSGGKKKEGRKKEKVKRNKTPILASQQNKKMVNHLWPAGNSGKFCSYRFLFPPLSPLSSPLYLPPSFLAHPFNFLKN